MQFFKALLISYVFVFFFTSCKSSVENQSKPTNELTVITDRNSDKSQKDTLGVKKAQVKIQNVQHDQVEDTIHCNIRIVRETKRNIEGLNSSDVELFLRTFTGTCLNNAEFSEFGNEMLFKVLELYPSDVISCLSYQGQVDTDFILSELSNPIFDINSVKLIKKIESTEGSHETKKKIITALKEAM
jgi:hypothetical protein